ncbi:type II 3-dehydroquinate dehydratase [Planctomycetota bacterium]
MLILLLNGPNLNLLGEREPEVYGTTTLRSIEAMVRTRAAQRQAAIEAVQSNHEGELIDCLHRARSRVRGVVLNPGALTHYSYALRDAIVAIRPPVAEVHLLDLDEREESWQKTSVLRDVCAFTIMGKGPRGYVVALDRLLDRCGAPPAFGGGVE